MAGVCPELVRMVFPTQTPPRALESGFIDRRRDLQHVINGIERAHLGGYRFHRQIDEVGDDD